MKSPKTVAIGLMSAAALTLAGSPVLAQSMASAADSAFLMKAAQANMAEVAAGKMAGKMGSPAIQKLGMKLAMDHAMNEKKVAMLAKSMHVMLPAQPAPADKAMMMKVMGMSGMDFDKAYVAMEEQGHMKNIKAFKMEAAMTKNAMIKSYAMETLPALEMHLQMAETDSSKMRTKMMNSSMGSGSMGSGSMGSGSMGSGGSQNFGRSSSSGGQDGTPASSGAGGSNPGMMRSSPMPMGSSMPMKSSSPMPMSSGAPMPMGSGSPNMSPKSGGQIGTPGSSGAGGSGNTNTGPNTSGSGGGPSTGSGGGSGSMSNPAPNNGTGGAPNPTASPNVPPGQKTN